MIRRNFFMRNYMTDSAFQLSDLRLYNLRLLCFWPIFFLVFTYAEKFSPQPTISPCTAVWTT